jgi:hypothetical protein
MDWLVDAVKAESQFSVRKMKRGKEILVLTIQAICV